LIRCFIIAIWNKILTDKASLKTRNNYVIYGGTINADLEQGRVISWRNAENLIKKL